MSDLNDNRLAAFARGDEVPTAQDVSDVAAELLRARKIARADSRRALQVRRLRWSVENLIVKAEDLGDALRTSVVAGETRPHSESILVALGRLAERLGELLTEVRVQPLELDEISVESLIVKWLRIVAHETSSEMDRELLLDVIDKIERGHWREVLRG